MDRLYDNIGGKLKGLAKATFIVEAIASVIGGLVMFFEDEIFIFIALVGPIVAFVSSWLLYAFGELVEDVHSIRRQNLSAAKEYTPTPEQPSVQLEEISAPIVAPKRTAETKANKNMIFYEIGKDIPEGEHKVSSTNPQGGMLFVYSTDNVLLDRRYVKESETINFVLGTKVTAHNCEIVRD